MEADKKENTVNGRQLVVDHNYIRQEVSVILNAFRMRRILLLFSVRNKVGNKVMNGAVILQKMVIRLEQTD